MNVQKYFLFQCFRSSEMGKFREKGVAIAISI